MEKEPRKKSLSLEATEEEKVMQIEKKRKILEVETSVSLQTTATGCSECNMGFHRDLTRSLGVMLETSSTPTMRDTRRKC